MSFLFSEDYYKVQKNGVSPFQNMCAYLGGSAIQTVGDNPVTAYRQLVQQYAKDLAGNAVDPNSTDLGAARDLVTAERVRSRMIHGISDFLARRHLYAPRDVRHFGDHYAETLRRWRERFDRAIDEGRLPASFDQHFVGLWRYYLMYCEGGFRGGTIDVAQVTLVKPAA